MKRVMKWLVCMMFPLVGLHGDDQIALLFLTVGEINHANLWEKQLKDDERFSIYVHSKSPIQHPFFAPRRIVKIVPTSWSNHMNAWQELLKEAVKDERNKKFVFLSDSCVPLRPLEDTYHALIQDDRAYMCFRAPWWSKTSSREVVELPEEHRWGNGEWVILNRRYALMIAQDETVIKYVAQHDLDVEAYPSSLLSVHGCLHNADILCQESTFANWDKGSSHPYQYQGADHPYLFKDDSVKNVELLLEARRGGLFFARKVASTFPQDVLEQVMYME